DQDVLRSNSLDQHDREDGYGHSYQRYGARVYHLGRISRRSPRGLYCRTNHSALAALYLHDDGVCRTVGQLDIIGRDRLWDHRGRDVGHGRMHLSPVGAPEDTGDHDSPTYHPSRGPGRKADCLFHGDHRSGFCTTVYDDRSPWEDFRAHVHYIWVCPVWRTLDG